jgi:signal transduction histidine kinase/ActR/RegA family two-component response regulator
MITGQDNVLQSTRVPGQGRHAPEELIQTALQYMQEIADSKQPLVIPNTETDNRRTHKTAKVQFKSWAGAPVVLQGEVVALLTVSSSSPEMYRPNDAAVLTAFAGQAAIAIKNARLYNEVQQHVEQLKKLTDITQRITATLDVTETLNLVTEKTAQLLAADIVSVILVDGAQDKPWLVVASGPAAAFSQEQREPDIHSLAGRAIAGGVSLLLMDMGQEDEWHTLLVNDDNYLPRSAICVPLRNRDQVVGAIEVLSRIPQAFDENDLQLLTLLARPAATAMENAQLYEKARQEISDRKRAEAALAEERAHLAQHVEERTAELKVAVAELARASRLKDDFLASMSHELRTPLNTILGMVEALQDSVYGPLNKNQGSSLQAIGESGTHLLSLINDILDVSKIEGGKLELEPLPVSVRSVCEASVRFVSREAHKKQLDVNLDLDQAPDSIMVDERRFKQILVNLLSNAVKFTPAGGRVGLRVWADAASQLVHFEVWDTGIGLAPEEIERLFQPFMQVDSRLSREYNGTGLGLALVYRLTRLHEGSVVVDSEVGSGSQFTISLPWQASSDSHDVGQSYKVETRPPGLAVRTDHSPVRILLAEDNEVAITAVTDYLSVLGHKIMAARTGREAVDIAIRSRPDIILMDVAMPKMDGLEAIRLIRKTDGLKDTPIVAVTALAMTGDKERCLRAGATDYLSKPISLKLLVEMIQRYTPLSDAKIAAGQGCLSATGRHRRAGRRNTRSRTAARCRRTRRGRRPSPAACRSPAGRRARRDARSRAP